MGKLTEAQHIVLTMLSYCSPSRRAPMWNGNTLRSLEKTGLVESGVREHSITWWDFDGDEHVEIIDGPTRVYRITEAGRAALEGG